MPVIRDNILISALSAFGQIWSSKIAIQDRIRTQNGPPDFDRDYPSQQIPVISTI